MMTLCVKDGIGTFEMRLSAPRCINEVSTGMRTSLTAILCINIFSSMSGGLPNCWCYVGIDPQLRVFVAKIRNPTYEYVRQLKGNSPKIQFSVL